MYPPKPRSLGLVELLDSITIQSTEDGVLIRFAALTPSREPNAMPPDARARLERELKTSLVLSDEARELSGQIDPGTIIVSLLALLEAMRRAGGVLRDSNPGIANLQ